VAKLCNKDALSLWPTGIGGCALSIGAESPVRPLIGASVIQYIFYISRMIIFDVNEYVVI
jgi:hypothetical protein